ncbi:MAG: 16S rRNA processing protein RimM [Deltaproteobacteria bacterium]|nr:16S rRNA processing protein RimM [Deltaproteobacteria bacterium]
MAGKKALVPVGICSKPHGIRGCILFKPFNKTTEMISRGKRLFTGEGNALSISAAKRTAEGTFIIGFEGIEDRGAAEKLRNITFYCRRDDLAEPENGEYYCCDLIGLDVRGNDGRLIGKVKDVIRTNVDILQVVDGKAEYLVPMIEGAVLEISEEGIVIDPDRAVSG